MRRTIGALIPVAAIGLFCVAGCGGGSDAMEPEPGDAPQTATVNLSLNSFVPAQTTIAVGGTVTFRNQSGVLHDVDFGTPTLHIGVFESGQRSLTFPTAGTLSYFCNIHAGMEGTIVVR